MSYLNCPRCGLAIIVRGAPPLIDGCPSCLRRGASPTVAPAHHRPASDLLSLTTNGFATIEAPEPGIDRLLAALRDDPGRTGNGVPAGRNDASPPSGTAA